MAEITPITPYGPVITIQKVERDQRQKQPPRQQPKPKPEQSKTDRQPSEHIDERV